MSTSTTSPSRLIPTRAAAALLGVSPYTLAKWVRERRPGIPQPVRHTPRCMRFVEAEIVAYLESRGPLGHVATA